MIEKICLVCNDSFLTYNKNQQTCSKSCSGKLSKKDLVTRFERVCPICGISFVTWPSINQQTCSVSCGMKLRIKTQGHPKGMLGKRGYWTGKKRDMETNIQISKTKKEYLKTHDVWNKDLHIAFNDALKKYYEKYPEKKLENAKRGGNWHREHSGPLSPSWKGGFFLYYGENWEKSKQKVKKHANFVSEISGTNGGKMAVHHIIPQRTFIQKYIDLCLFNIPSIKISSFKVLPYDLIPLLILEEANSEENLIHLTQPEHTEFEGMPPTFFEAIKLENELWRNVLPVRK